ncbi:MAG: TetR/AcrR family transcriptional regulator [Pseudonocardiaceae bacterium]
MRSNEGSGKRTFLDQARRAQIVGTAIETIAELGYANTSLAQIAERAGTSKGVILYHFAGKDELIAQVVAEIFAVAAAEVGPKVQAAGTTAGQLRAFIEARVGFLATHRAHMQALLDIWISHRDPDGRLLLDSHTAEPNLARIEELLRTGQGAGEFRDFPTRPMAVAISQAIDGVLLQLISDPGLDLDVFARELVTIFNLATRRNP